MDLSEFVAALTGGVFALTGVYIAHLLGEKRRRREEADVIQGLLQGLHDEIETLSEIYYERVGAAVEALQDGQGFESYWVVTQDYFTVYSSNCHLVGKIPDVDLRKEVIVTYTTAKSLLDTFRMNNELVNRLEQSVLLANETKNQQHVQEAIIRRKQLALYANSLKKIHASLKPRVSSLLRNLRKHGVLHEAP
jgi:hypothetical protein